MHEQTFFKIPHSMLRAVVTGGWNTILSTTLLNAIVWVTGIVRGPWIIGFSAIIFCIVLTQSYLLNRWWVFSHRPHGYKTSIQLGTFALVASGAAVVSTTILHFVVNVIGAPTGVPPQLWINVAILISMPFSFLTGYVGNRLFVFKRSDMESAS